MVKLERDKNMDKCYICGGKLKKEKTDIARYWGKELVVLNDVPSLICIKCGERYFDAKVSSQIDQKIQQVIKRKTNPERIEVPLVQF